MPTPLLLQIIFAYLLFCLVAGFLGRRRRIGFWGFVFLSVLLTPLITILFIFFAAQGKRRRVVVKPKRA